MLVDFGRGQAGVGGGRVRAQRLAGDDRLGDPGVLLQGVFDLGGFDADAVDFELAGFGAFLLEHLRGRARVGGQPVEVFFRERFGRVSGGEDYPDHAVFIEDRNCK